MKRNLCFNRENSRFIVGFVFANQTFIKQNWIGFDFIYISFTMWNANLYVVYLFIYN